MPSDQEALVPKTRFPVGGGTLWLFIDKKNARCMCSKALLSVPLVFFQAIGQSPKPCPKIQPCGDQTIIIPGSTFTHYNRSSNRELLPFGPESGENRIEDNVVWDSRLHSDFMINKGLETVV